MSITFMPMIHDPATNEWRIPQAVRVDPDRFEFNVANANGFDLLLALGLAPESCGELALDAFAGLVTAGLRRHLGHRSPEMATVTDAAPGRMTMIFCGRREGYLEERLGDLARLAQRGREAGATHISWS